MVAASAIGVQASEPAPNGLRVRDRGWTASLFVSPAERHRLADEAEGLREVPTTVNARLWRRLSRTARVAVDVTNVFDRPALPLEGNTLFEPAPVPGRGLVLRFRKTF